MTARLFILQRATAILMVPLIAVHLAVIFYATSRGVTAAEILARTRGSWVAGAGYGVFVAAASIHAAIGVRSVAREWGGLAGRRLDLVLWAVGLGLALLGARAVAAVVLP